MALNQVTEKMILAEIDNCLMDLVSDKMFTKESVTKAINKLDILLKIGLKTKPKKA